VTVGWALVRNVGTCRSDAKGEPQMGIPHERKSTEAGHRGGGVRSRAEGPVMGLDRRDTIVQGHLVANRQREERRDSPKPFGAVYSSGGWTIRAG
jgi:hypothetical protein